MPDFLGNSFSGKLSNLFGKLESPQHTGFQGNSLWDFMEFLKD